MKKVIWQLFFCVSLAAALPNLLRTINHGEEAHLSEFPYVVSINILKDSFCGGVLVSKRHVVTAAHCVSRYVNDNYSDLTKYLRIEVGSVVQGTGKYYQVRRISYHKDYYLRPRPAQEMVLNDVAVIHLSKPVIINQNVQVIKLPKKSFEVPENTTVIVTGFGISGYQGVKLRKFDASTINCEASFKNRTYLHNICTKYQPGYGLCYGDSGSPLVDSSKKLLLGIASTSAEECASGNEPDVFVNISYYLNYITEEIEFNYATSQSVHPSIMVDQ